VGGQARERADAGAAAPELSILVPTYNEAGNIPELLRRIARVMTERQIACEVLILDDRSPDGTAATAREVDVPVPVRVIEREGPRGLSPAVIEGFGLARGRYVLVMDADLQHPPEAIVDVLGAVRSGADMVIGSRYVSGGRANEFAWYRRAASRLATMLAVPLIGRQVRDPMAGFFCVKRELVEGHKLSAIGYKIGLELLVKCRPAQVIEVPIRFGARLAGDSKMDLGEQVAYLRHLRRLYGWRWPTATQGALFCTVGAMGMGVDLGLMTLLVGSGLAFAGARVISVAAAMLCNFLLNRRVTFPESMRGHCGTQFARFVGACTLGAGINWAVSSGLYTLVPAMQPLYLLCCVAGIVAGTVNNFLLSKYLAFRMKPECEAGSRT